MTGKLFRKAAVLAVFAAAAGCAAAFPGVDAHSSESRDAAQSLYEVIAAEIAAHREQPEVALALLDQTLARTKSSEVGELAWRTALQTRNPDIVLEQARAWAAIDPKAGLARRTILVNAVEKGRQSEYVELLSRMYADAEDKAELITDVTTLLAQPETASAALETVLSPYWEKQAKNARVQLAVGPPRHSRRLPRRQNRRQALARQRARAHCGGRPLLAGRQGRNGEHPQELSGPTSRRLGREAHSRPRAFPHGQAR